MKATHEKKAKAKGDLHCYNCDKEGQYAYACLHNKLTAEQRAELAQREQAHLMNVEEEEHGKGSHEAVELLSVIMFNGRAGLDDDRLYLENCSTVTAIKNKKHLPNLRDVDGELNVSCNAGVTRTRQVGSLGSMECLYMPEGIVNILLIHGTSCT